MKRRGLVIRVQEGGPSSAEQSRDPKVWSAIRGNILGGFVDKDKHPGGTGQRKAI